MFTISSRFVQYFQNKKRVFPGLFQKHNWKLYTFSWDSNESDIFSPEFTGGFFSSTGCTVAIQITQKYPITTHYFTSIFFKTHI